MGKNKFFVTFTNRRAFRNKYVIIKVDKDAEGNANDIARQAVWDHFGNKWMTVYPHSDLRRQIVSYGLKELTTILVNRFGHYDLEEDQERMF